MLIIHEILPNAEKVKDGYWPVHTILKFPFTIASLVYIAW